MLFKWSCTTEPTLKTVEQLNALYTLYKYKEMCGAAKHQYGFVKQRNQRIHGWSAKGWSYRKQGKSEGFYSCDPPSDLAKIGSKLSNILARATLKYEGWLRKIIENLFHVPTSHCVISEPSVNSNLTYRRETLKSSQIVYLSTCVTLKFGRWPRKTIGHIFYIT